MGYDAACTLRFDGRTERGTAFLEHKHLIFRGPSRLAIPLKEISEARADGRTLHVCFGSKRAAFEIGKPAVKWVERINNPPSRLDKLGVKRDMRVALIGMADEEFEGELAGRQAHVQRQVRRGEVVDAVFYLARRRADLARLGALAAAIAPAGAVWVIRPKGRPEITEADSMSAGRKAGLVDVKVVSFSETHTAEKYVVPRSSRQLRAPSRGVNPAATRARSRRSSSASPRRS